MVEKHKSAAHGFIQCFVMLCMSAVTYLLVSCCQLKYILYLQWAQMLSDLLCRLTHFAVIMGVD